MSIIGKGKTEEDFKGRFVRATVIPRKIDAALAQLGPKGYEDNMGFTRRAGVSANDLAAFRDQYRDYIIEAREVGGDSRARILWCGSKEFAKRLRGLIDGNQE
jgi:hypothetical protein